MKNDYEVRGEVTAIFLKSPKYGDMEVLISTNKLDRAKEIPNSWTVAWREDCNTFYVMGSMTRLDGRTKKHLLHRWINNVNKGIEIDHFDHNGLNNTDNNLRLATSSENKQNKKSARSDSTSGIRGVFWNKHHNRWMAKIKVDGKQIHVGLFKDIGEAERAVKEARRKYMPFSQEALSS
jgi:hypothetical protein